MRLSTETEHLDFLQKIYYLIDAPAKVDKVEASIQTTMFKSEAEIKTQTEDYLFIQSASLGSNPTPTTSI